MKRLLLLASLILLLSGCQLPPERLPSPLPEDGKVSVTYAELLTRARAQARVANESFYVDKWTDLEDAARGLEQTAKFLPKATEVPAKQKDTLPVVAGDLGKEAGALRDAAKAKDVEKTDDSLKRIHQTVRRLRIE